MVYMERVKCTAVILAAGVGKRMQSNVAKQYLLLDGKPVLWYALNIFEKSELIDEIVLVVGKGEIDYCREKIIKAYGFGKVTHVIEGGAERYLSVWEALKILQGNQGIIFIHDGARPFVTEDIIKNTYAAAMEYGACVTGMPVKDTIKISDENGFAVQTPNRKTVWQIQTPQVFAAELIIESYKELVENLEKIKTECIEITDDAMVVETLKSKSVRLVKGSYENIKITTPEDMKIAESLILQND